MEHIFDDDLERYHLGQITSTAALAQIEEHLLSCPSCVLRAQKSDDYVDAIRAAFNAGDFDLL